ncbi:MAG: site-2 protease family protein [Candidatus Babeliaceae bacterium]
MKKIILLTMFSFAGNQTYASVDYNNIPQALLAMGCVYVGARVLGTFGLLAHEFGHVSIGFLFGKKVEKISIGEPEVGKSSAAKLSIGPVEVYLGEILKPVLLDGDTTFAGQSQRTPVKKDFLVTTAGPLAGFAFCYTLQSAAQSFAISPQASFLTKWASFGICVTSGLEALNHLRDMRPTGNLFFEADPKDDTSDNTLMQKCISGKFITSYKIGMYAGIGALSALSIRKAVKTFQGMH